MLRRLRFEDMRINDVTLFTLIKAKAPMIFIIGTFLICVMKVYFYLVIVQPYFFYQ